MKRAEFDALKTKVASTIEDAYADDGVFNFLYENTFARPGGITIIVGDRPSGQKWETVDADDAILYVNLAALNDGTLEADLINALLALGTNDMAKAKKQNRVRFGGGMSPFELAQLQKRGYVRGT